MPNFTPWTHSHSDALSMRFAHRQTPLGPEVMTEDKVRYSATEVKILSLAGAEICLGAHLVKKVFDGVIVDVGPPAKSSGPVPVPRTH